MEKQEIDDFFIWFHEGNEKFLVEKLKNKKYNLNEVNNSLGVNILEHFLMHNRLDLFYIGLKNHLEVVDDCNIFSINLGNFLLDRYVKKKPTSLSEQINNGFKSIIFLSSMKKANLSDKKFAIIFMQIFDLVKEKYIKNIDDLFGKILANKTTDNIHKIKKTNIAKFSKYEKEINITLDKILFEREIPKSKKTNSIRI